MRALSIVVALVGMLGCDGDPLPPELRELVPCAGVQCERACLASERDPSQEACRFSNGFDDDLECGYVGGLPSNGALVNGMRGCCAFGPDGAVRWHECQ